VVYNCTQFPFECWYYLYNVKFRGHRPIRNERCEFVMLPKCFRLKLGYQHEHSDKIDIAKVGVFEHRAGYVLHRGEDNERKVNVPLVCVVSPGRVSDD
jgi:hypothetical protein